MLAYLSINQLWNLITFGIMCQFHTEFTGLCLVCIISPSCTWTCGGAGVSSLTLILSPCCVLWHGSMPICVCLCVRVSKKETGGRTVAQMCLKHFKANEARRQWHRHHSYAECITLCILEIQKESYKTCMVTGCISRLNIFSYVDNHKFAGLEYMHIKTEWNNYTCLHIREHGLYLCIWNGV